MERQRDTATKDSAQRVAAPRPKVLKAARCPLREGYPREDSRIPSGKNTVSSILATLLFLKGKEKVGIEDILQAGCIKKMKDGVKLLSDGEIDFPIKISVHRASQKAIEKIQAQGGEVEVLI